MTKFTTGNTRAAELTPGQVIEILELYAQGWTQGRLAVRFGKSVGSIGRIVRRESHQRITLQFESPPTPTTGFTAEQSEAELLKRLGLTRPGVDEQPSTASLDRLMQMANDVKAEEAKTRSTLAEVGIEDDETQTGDQDES